jgi:ATP-dependent DNA helicase 2 subunit 2
LTWAILAPPKTVHRARKDAHQAGEDDDDELIDLGAPVPTREPVPHPYGLSTEAPEKAELAQDSETEAESDAEIEASPQKKQKTEFAKFVKTPSPKAARQAALPTPARSSPAASPPSDEGRAPGRIIGNTTPLEDFKTNLEEGDVVSQAVRDLGAVIKEIIMKPFASRRHQEMLECMKEMRKVALEVRVY